MSRAESHTERREFPRVPVGIHVVEIDEDATYFQYATDLSGGGMFLFGTAPREVGHQVTVLFKLPGEDAINRIPAEVVGNADGERRGTHIKFVDRDDSNIRERVRAYVDRAASS